MQEDMRRWLQPGEQVIAEVNCRRIHVGFIGLSGTRYEAKNSLLVLTDRRCLLTGVVPYDLLSGPGTLKYMAPLANVLVVESWHPHDKRKAHHFTIFFTPGGLEVHLEVDSNEAERLYTALTKITVQAQ